MKTKFLIPFIIFSLPTIVLGQANDCYSIKHLLFKNVPCYLTPLKQLNDTFISILPKPCNNAQFDTTADGNWKIYLHDSLTLIEILGIKKGLRHGTDIEFYDNGQLETVANYLYGKLNGSYISYYDNGEVSKQGTYVNNEFTGTEFEYWDNSKIARKTIYTSGISHGFDDQKYWDKNGERINYETYSKLWYDCD